jgi:hypothetical protein
MMTFSPQRVPRLGRSIACALAFAAVAIPFAEASGSQGKYGPLDPWAYRLVQQAHKYGPLDPWAYAAIRRGSVPARQAVTERPTLSTAATNGFDWADAALGASATLGLLVIAAGAINTVRRRRRGVAPVRS